MTDGMKKAALIAAGFALGGAVCAAASGGRGRRACVSLVNKAIKLKETVGYSLESMKESVDDIVAEAKAMDEGDECCSCGCGADDANA